MIKIIRLIDFAKVRIGKLSAAFVSCLLFQAMVIPVLPLPGKLLLDRFQGPGNTGNVKADQDQSSSMVDEFFASFSNLSIETLLYYVTIMTVVLGLVLAVAHIMEMILAGRINQRTLRFLRESFNEKILSRELSYLHGKKKVDLMGRVSTDIEKTQLIFAGGFTVLFKSIPTIILTLAAMLMTDFLVSIIFLAIIPILYGAAFSLSKPVKLRARAVRETGVDFQDQLVQSYSLFSMIKSLRSEKRVLADLTQKNEKFLDAFIKHEAVQGYFYGSLIFVKALTRAVVLMVGCYFILKNRITFGDFFLFFAYLEALIHPIDEISRFSTKWSKTLVSIDRLYTLDQELDKAPEKSGDKVMSSNEPSFVFKDVGFAYHNGGEDIFKNLSINLEGKQLIALVGPSGCGKSTFMSLFNGLYKPGSGEVFFNGLSLKDWNFDQLRKEVLLIGQENFLMPGTVLENISLAESECSEETAWKALEKVGASDFVESLPDKLETVVGEGGHGLSGGQSRRLSLSRGFALDNAKVCLFDEPTSGLDPKTGVKVVQSLREYSEKSLVIFSTHRLDEAQYADQILVFSKGEEPKLYQDFAQLSDEDLGLSKPLEH